MDLIDREQVLDVVFNIMTDNKITHKHRALNRNIKQIATTPINAERRARWVRKRRDGFSSNRFYCTNCNHYELSEDGYFLPDYCKYCGCKMN